MEHHIKRTNPLRYAFGMFGTSIPINMFKTYAAKFYVDTLGLSTDSYALILFVYTFVDAIDNPVYGYLSDRTRTKWGRRRPWLVIGALLLGLSFIAFFNPPGFVTASTLLFTYCFILYMITGTLDSLVNANYGALFPDLFTEESVRAKTNAFRQAFQLVAMVISLALTPMVVSKLNDIVPDKGYAVTALIYAVLGVGAILFCTFGCHENPKYATSEKPRFWSTVLALVTNKKFWIFGLANAFYSAAMSLVMQAVSFYVKYTLGLPDAQTMFLMAAVLLAAMLAIPCWVFLIKKLRLLPVWRIALAVLGIGYIPLYFADSLITALLASLLVGLGFAGAISTFDLIGARIIDEDSKKYNLRREGIFNSAMGVMNRLNGLFVSFGFLFVNRYYGFISGDEPGAYPGEASRFLLTVFPFILMIFSFVFAIILRFPDTADVNEQIGSKGDSYIEKA